MPPAQGTNGLAIASLIFGLIGGLLLSVPFGFIALSQIRRRPQAGRGLAIAGLVLFGCWVALFAIGIVAAVLSGPERDADGEVTSSGSVSVNQVKVGDCVDGIRDGRISFDLTVHPCAKPHDGEVVHQYNLSGSWPGSDTAADRAQSGCTSVVRSRIQDSPMADRLRMFMLYPSTRSAWNHDRGVLCLVVAENGDKLTGKATR